MAASIESPKEKDLICCFCRVSRPGYFSPQIAQRKTQSTQRKDIRCSFCDLCVFSVLSVLKNLVGIVDQKIKLIASQNAEERHQIGLLFFRQVQLHNQIKEFNRVLQGQQPSVMQVRR